MALLPYDFFLDHLKTDQLTVGNIFFPYLIGSEGQILSADGAGNIIFSDPLKSVTTPVTDYSVVTWRGTDGLTIGDSPVIIDDVTGRVTTPFLTVGAISYPSVDGTNGQMIVTDGSGTLSFISPSVPECLVAELNIAQNTNIGDGDHIKFDNVQFSSGSSISLDTTTPYTTTPNVPSIGRFTLLPNITYRIKLTIPKVVINRQTSFVVFSLYDSTNDAILGKSVEIRGVGQLQGNIVMASGNSIFHFTPSVSTLLHVEIINQSGLIEISNAYIEISKC
jgi:hypothetical protein